MRKMLIDQKFHLLFLSGFGGIGKDHWQYLWSLSNPNTHILQQSDWERPVYHDWESELNKYLRAWPYDNVVFIAHSLGTSLVMRWAAHNKDLASKVRAAFLVAPTDRDCFDKDQAYPIGFGPMIFEKLPFPSIVLASSNDEKVSLDRAKCFSEAWGAEFIDVGRLGHVGSMACLGAWPLGKEILERFLSKL